MIQPISEATHGKLQQRLAEGMVFLPVEAGWSHRLLNSSDYDMTCRAQAPTGETVVCHQIRREEDGEMGRVYFYGKEPVSV